MEYDGGDPKPDGHGVPGPGQLDWQHRGGPGGVPVDEAVREEGEEGVGQPQTAQCCVSAASLHFIYQPGLVLQSGRVELRQPGHLLLQPASSSHKPPVREEYDRFH